MGCALLVYMFRSHELVEAGVSEVAGITAELYLYHSTNYGAIDSSVGYNE